MTIDNSKTLERIKILTELHGAPGFEDEVRSYMKKWNHTWISLFKIRWVVSMV